MPLTKASYSMVTGAPLNILDYGADPTGVADSSAAFALVVGSNRNVIVPAGNYRVTSTVTIPPSTLTSLLVKQTFLSRLQK